MLNISVTGADNKKGRCELRKFDKLINKEFKITQKLSIKFTKIYYYKGFYQNTNKTTISKELNERAILQAPTSNVFSVLINDPTYTQQQTTLIHPANIFQGVNLIYSVNTN